MTLHVRAKVLLHVWSYEVYDTTLLRNDISSNSQNFRTLFQYYLQFGAIT